MDIKRIKDTIGNVFKKNKYIILILVIGLAFMLIPGKIVRNSDSTREERVDDTSSYTALDDELASILSRINGVGNTYVLLTLSAGEEAIYQTDTDTSFTTDTNTTKIDTVILSTTDRSQSGLIRQINPPKYLGAIIVCEGGDNASVRFAVVDAVSKVTGLGADCISVLKMK